jgi:hypothetical protein
MLLRAVVVALAIISTGAAAHDPTGFWAREYAAGRSPPPAWWNALKARGGGLCCSHADGLALKDVDWDTQCDVKDGAVQRCYFRVHFVQITINGTLIEDEWTKVPDDAVVVDPNRYGAAVVWPYIAMNGNEPPHAAIRCFMPGAQG